MPRLEQIVTTDLPAAAASHDPDQHVHPSFRLFLTSSPSPHFPPAVLQAAVKVAVEPPRGVRAQALRALAALPPGHLSACDAAGRGPEWRRLVLSGVLLHAVVQERRRYGSLGWNRQYEFSEGDLSCSLAMLQMFLLEGTGITTGCSVAGSGMGTRGSRRAGAGPAGGWGSGRGGVKGQPSSPGLSSPVSPAGLGISHQYAWVPGEGLQYVTGQINYGGRVTDDNDRRLLAALVGRHYRPEVLAPAAKVAGEIRYE